MKQPSANNQFDMSQAEREKKKSLLEKLEAKKAEQAKIEAQEAERKKKKEVLKKIEKMKAEDDKAARADSEIEYTVKPGDTLSKIAQAHGVQWQEVADYNKLANPDLIYPDQVIKIKK